ncbi:MAG: hypothetical protein M0Z52_00345 [Actinomycetota bacterium]|nr:hypothetical protein [Actinomycetota bacterium]
MLKFALAALVLAALVSGCAGSDDAIKTTQVNTYFSVLPVKAVRVRIRVEQLVQKLNRNLVTPKTKEWLKTVYGSIKIKNLEDIPRSSYSHYKKYAVSDNRAVYIIVFPGYYCFFDKTRPAIITSGGSGYPQKGVAYKLLAQTPGKYDYKFMLIQQQEYLMRQFLMIKSAERKMIILIVPGDYKKAFTYGKSSLDEYARYINETTGMSDSVLYLPSKSASDASLSDDDMNKLTDFLTDIDTRNVYLGGGYVKSLGQFYGGMSGGEYDYNVFFVPELIDLSPKDLDNPAPLISNTKHINFYSQVFTDRLNAGTLASEAPNLKHIHVYYGVPTGLGGHEKAEAKLELKKGRAAEAGQSATVSGY